MKIVMKNHQVFTKKGAIESIPRRVFSLLFLVAAVVVLFAAFVYANQARQGPAREEIARHLACLPEDWPYLLIDETNRVLVVSSSAAPLLGLNGAVDTPAQEPRIRDDIRNLPSGSFGVSVAAVTQRKEGLPFRARIEASGKVLSGVAFPLGNGLSACHLVVLCAR